MLDAFIARLTPLRICTCVAVVAVLLYAPAVFHGFIDIDDPGFIVRSALSQDATIAGFFRAFGSPVMLLYLPLTIISYQWDFLLGGVHPWIYHATDILLHAGNAVLLSLIVLRLTKRSLPALVCGLLFAVHPLNTEAVLWASSRKDLLSALFALLSLLSYIRYAQDGDVRHRWWSIGFYLLGLLSKIAIAPLPIAFFVVDTMEGRGSLRSLFLEKIPYAVAAVPLSILGIVAGNQFALALGPAVSLLLGAKGTAFLLLQFLWPWQLSLLHLQNGAVTAANPVFALSLVILVLLWAVVVILWKKRICVPAFGLFLFALMMLPTYAAAQKAGLLFFTSDTYAYLPSVGLFIALAAFLDRQQQRWKALLLPVTALLFCVGIVFAAQTHRILPQWNGAESIERSVLSRDPGNAVALGNLGLILEQEGKPDEALADDRAAIASDPQYAIPYFDAAAVLGKGGHDDQAFAMYDKMIPMLTTREILGDRTLVQALGLLLPQLENMGRDDLAHALFNRLQQIAPQSLVDIKAMQQQPVAQ